MTGVRLVWRRLRRTPGLTAGMVAVIALGVGLNGAAFSFVYATLIRPLPYPEPARLAVAVNAATAGGRRDYVVGPGVLLALRDDATALLAVAGVKWPPYAPPVDLLLDDRAERAAAAYVTPNAFQVLGVRALVGRVFDARDGQGPTPPVVVSYDFWRRVFGQDPRVVGRVITLAAGAGGARHVGPATVVGVLPPDVHLTYPQEIELWLVEPWSDVAREPARGRMFRMIVRLAQGTSAASAEARVMGLVSRGAANSGGRSPAPLVLEPMAQWVSAGARPSLLLIWSVAGLVLLMTCATVANGLLVRLRAREREVAVLASLGASPRRVMWQAAGEGAALALGGTVTGCALVATSLPILRTVVPVALARGAELRAGGWLLLFGAAATAVVAVLASAVPALRIRRLDLVPALRIGAATPWRRQGRTAGGSVLVAGQSGIAVLLLVGAGLLLTSLWNLRHVDTGFDPRHVQTVDVRLLDAKYRDAAARAAFRADLLARIRALPGVNAVGMATAVPFRPPLGDYQVVFDPAGCEGRGAPPDCRDRAFPANVRTVSPAYFQVLRMAATRGRLLLPSDVAERQKAAVVSEDFARDMFGRADVIGTSFSPYPGLPPFTIVGTVGDLHYVGLDQGARAAVYVPSSDVLPFDPSWLLIRTSTDPLSAAVVRAAVRDVDPGVAATEIATLTDLVDASVAGRRFYTVATAVFAAVAVLLAAGGLLVVLARSVRDRRREFAVRRALGASPGRIAALVLRHGLAHPLAGVAIGLGLAWLAAHIVDRFLFQITAHDRAVYVLAGGAVLLAAAAVSVILARRANRTPPWEALRAE